MSGKRIRWIRAQLAALKAQVRLAAEITRKSKNHRAAQLRMRRGKRLLKPARWRKNRAILWVFTSDPKRVASAVFPMCVSELATH